MSRIVEGKNAKFFEISEPSGREHLPKVRFEKMQESDLSSKVNKFDVLPSVMSNQIYIPLGIPDQVDEQPT